MENRRCKKCGSIKPITDFEVTNKERGWRRHECKSCTKKRVTAWRKRSVDLIRATRTRHRLKNIERASKWNKAHPRRHNQLALDHYYRLQDQAIMAYGGYVCACCGETEPLFLTIDHVSNNGKEHRKTFRNSGDGLYKWLRKNAYPPGFQVLCMNCNHGKHRNKGVCPHQET